MALRRVVVSGVLAAAGVRGARAVLDASFTPRDPRWTRVNHRGQPISLLEGPAVAAGLALGALGSTPRAALSGAVAAGGGAAFGLVDDLTEDVERRRKGLRGHLGALAHGELTTGGLKVLGIGASALVAAAIAVPLPAARRSTTSTGRGAGALLGWAGDVVLSGALIAVSANLVNLLDLRPGRALKAAALVAAPAALAGSAPAGAVLGAAAAALPGDLAERDMLGDGGANAVGALLGTSLATAARPVRALVLAVAVALTLASERVSFTAVIARTPVLRELDAWGRAG